MSRMNWTRYFNLITLLGVLILTAGIATGVSVSDHDTPDTAEIGERITVTYTLEELYDEYDDWTLHGETNLTNVTWTVSLLDAGDNVRENPSYDGSEFEQPVRLEDDVAEVEVRVTGTVPPVTNYSYDPAETFRVAEFEQVREGGTQTTIASYDDTHHYTEDSQAAREAIDDAQAAVQDAGGDEQAEQTLENAISAYNSGTFDNAISLANQAEETATNSQQSQERNRLLMMAAGGLIAVGVIIGGVYWYRSNRTGPKL